MENENENENERDGLGEFGRIESGGFKEREREREGKRDCCSETSSEGYMSRVNSFTVFCYG